jgi:hypothetical protein
MSSEYEITSGQPAWFRALSRLKPALDTIHAPILCSEIITIEGKIANECLDALSRRDWGDLARLADELTELARFKELVCRD